MASQWETMGKRLDTLEEEIENLSKNIAGDVQNPTIQSPSVNLTLGKRLDAAEKTLEEIKDMLKNTENPSSPPASFFSTSAQDWLALIDAYFARHNVTEDWRVAITISKLKGAAELWWSTIGEPVRTWEDMKSRLEIRFLSRRQPMSMERMRIMVEVYTKEFRDFGIRI